MSEEVISIAKEILRNAHLARASLDAYEGLAANAIKLNGSQHKDTFGLIQQALITQCIIAICRIYDKTSSNKKKNTVFELLNAFESGMSKQLKDYDLKLYKLSHLGISEDKLSNKIDEVFVTICATIRNVQVQRVKEESLEKIKCVRNKIIAHSEQIEYEVKTRLWEELPDLNELREIISFAENVSVYVYDVCQKDKSFCINTSSYKVGIENMIDSIFDKRCFNKSYLKN